MTIEQLDVIDFITIDHATGDFWLSISDHLPWEDGENEHLFLLQEKINSYLRFIESGEILKKYPEARQKKLVINIGHKYPLSENAIRFIAAARSAIENAGFVLRTEHALLN
ncbi:DUF6572 domain-containing protein [Neorhizobium petrolearium]|uniref:DUF6572 domain-containing protein n=1 Tax=Neorhizobium petrolearium TaxID=515361 RepID=UPI003F7EC184